MEARYLEDDTGLLFLSRLKEDNSSLNFMGAFKFVPTLVLLIVLCVFFLSLFRLCEGQITYFSFNICIMLPWTTPDHVIM